MEIGQLDEKCSPNKMCYFSLFEQKMDFGTERVKKALKLHGNPEKTFRTIHISGTNGKGTVTKLVSSVLDHSGYITGTLQVRK